MSKFFSYKLKDMQPYVPGEQPVGMEKLIKLNTNENPFPPAPKAVEALGKFDAENLKRYNDPTAKNLISALAKVYGVEVENSFVANGSDEVLALIFKAFCPKSASFADITYGFYSVLCGLNAINQKIVPLKDDYTINIEDYMDVDCPVFIANPNAPTGICLPLSDIEKLLCQNPERLVIVDQAYVDFGGESAVPLLEKHSNLIVVGTFSKSRSLAGARLGFAFASKEIIADLNSVKFSFHPYNVNTLTQIIGTESVLDEEYFKSCCEKVVQIREYTKNELEKMNCIMLPSKTNFLFVNPVKCSGEQYYVKLRSKNIIVRYFDKDRLRSFVRVTIGTQKEMEIFINATKEILEEEV